MGELFDLDPNAVCVFLQPAVEIFQGPASPPTNKRILFLVVGEGILVVQIAREFSSQFRKLRKNQVESILVLLLDGNLNSKDVSVGIKTPRIKTGGHNRLVGFVQLFELGAIGQEQGVDVFLCGAAVVVERGDEHGRVPIKVCQGR